jgi:addiction module RelE/StbE family toxin
MKVRWTVPAWRDLEAIEAYIARDNPAAAADVGRQILEAAASLKRHPFRGRWDKRKRFRELVLAPLPYLIAYRVSAEFVSIIRIWHGAQRRR